MSVAQQALSMSLRTLVLLVASAEALLWALMVGNGLFSGSDPATKGLDRDLALMATAVFSVSGAPALGLAVWGRWIGLAAALSVFPLAALTAAVIWSSAS